MTTKITEQNVSNLANAGVDWQSVFVGDGSTGLTTVAGRGYFINTTSGTVTVTLPASPSAGDVVVLKDYARTWGTNNVSLASTTFDGVTQTNSFNTQGQTVTLVYMDGTKGWSLINEDTTTDLSAQFTEATGGTITTSGDFKIHTFTGDSNFVVSQVGTVGNPASVDYLVVAGGGGGGSSTGGNSGGGGGAGGYRESKSPVAGSYTASPLATPTGITVTAQTYPITVGGGGAGAPTCAISRGASGSTSVFSTITSAVGAGGGAGSPAAPGDGTGLSGGSGGGGGGGSTAPNNAGGSGNTPPVSPPQGNPGGGSRPSPSPSYDGAAGGGGGAGGAGSPTPNGSVGGAGGAHINTSITGSDVEYAGGAGGATNRPEGAGTPGGGGAGNSASPSAGPTAGSANTGGGGGASNCNGAGGAGGSGIVIIRYKFQ